MGSESTYFLGLVWILWLSKIILWFFHSCISSSSLCHWGASLCVNAPVFLSHHPLIEMSAVANRADVSVHSSRQGPRHGEAGSRGSCTLNLLRCCQTVLQRGCTMYVPVSSAWKFHFLPVLSNASHDHLFILTVPKVCSSVSGGGNLHFPSNQGCWALFLCITFGDTSAEIICSFNNLICFFPYVDLRVIYLFIWLWVLCQIYDLQLFLPSFFLK